MLKHVLAFLAFMMVSLVSVHADEGYIPFFPDFLEPNPIGWKIRYGLINSDYPLTINKYIITKQSNVNVQQQDVFGSKFNGKYKTPITIELEENILSNFMFYGLVFDFDLNVKNFNAPAAYISGSF